MKSKIQTNQILMKGMSILLLLIMIFSIFSTVLVSFAVEEEEGDDIASNESIVDDESLDSPSTEELIESLVTDINELKQKIEDLEKEENEYEEFRAELESNYDVIEINNELKLRTLSLFVAEGNTCKGRTFIITNNIELTSTIEWDPIGSTAHTFRGTIDGRGHTITGMNINTKMSYAGFIGYLYEGTVKNLKIEKSFINMNPNITDTINDLSGTTETQYKCAGAFVGGARFATIINCVNEADITAGTNVGGIVGFVGDKTIIEDCINKGDIKGYSRVGGIVGHAYQSNADTSSADNTLVIKRCINNGTVYGATIDIGGIAGNVRYNSLISKCQNNGIVATSMQILETALLGKNVKINPQNVGGIVGTTGGNGKKQNEVVTIIEYCINEENAKIYGYKDIGGIVGQLGNSHLGYSRVSNSINYSKDVTSTKQNYNGGIAGMIGDSTDKNYQSGRIYNCYYITNLTKATYKDLTYAQKKPQNTGESAGGIGAFGKLQGSDGGSDTPNLAFKIVKDAKEGYYYEGRVYWYDKSKNDAGVADRTLYKALENTTKGVTWKRANWSNKGEPESEINNSSRVYYPGVGSNVDPYVPTDKNKTNNAFDEELLKTYQCWLYRITTKGRLEVNSSNKIVIDTQKPKVESITLSTETGESIAVPGDTMVFTVKFSENVTVNRNLTLQFKLKYYNVQSGSNQTEDRTAKFAGIDGNTAIYTYKIKKADAGNAADKTENRLIRNITLAEGNFKDVFGNANEKKEVTKAIDDDFVILKNDYCKSKTYTSDSKAAESLGASIAYRFYDPDDDIEFDGTTGYLKDGFNVRAVIHRKILTTFGTNVELKLHIKLNDGTEIVHTYADGKDEIKNSAEDNYSHIYFRNINSNGKNGKISEVYLTVSSDVTLQGSTTTTTKFTRNNTLAKIDYMYLDNTPPTVGKRISSKTYYAVGDKIVVALDIADNYALENLTAAKLPILKMKFGTGEYKNVEPNTVVKDDQGMSVEVLYEYTIQEGDDGELTIGEVKEKTIYDVAGNARKITKKEFELESKKYADSSNPTITITPSNVTNEITNSNEITYTFTWSEEVAGFDAEDITVMGAVPGKLSALTKNENGTYSATMPVTANVPLGNEGIVKVVVEAAVVKDSVGLDNIRAESIVKIDRKAPTLTNYSIKKSEDGTQIIIQGIFDEAIGTAKTSDIEIKFGKTPANGKISSATINSKDNRVVTYVYNISGADDGNPIIVLKANTVKDIAGNLNSIDTTLVNDIVLQRSVIIVDGVEYSFSKNGTSIVNFANPTYFKAGDTITVTKHVIGESKSTNYEHLIDEKCDLTHMKYMSLESNEAKFSGESGNINISAANIYFDTIHPTIKTEVSAEDKIGSGIYLEDDKIIIKVTTSEEIKSEKIIPEIQVRFSNSGKGKYNYESENNTGLAKYKKEEVNQDGTTTLYYEYIIKEGDEGEVSISFISGQISDLVGNVTNIKDLYSVKGPKNKYTEANQIGVNIKNVEFFTNSNCTQEINPIEGTSQSGDIYIKVTLEDGLYTDINTAITTKNAPNMKLNGEIETETINVLEKGSVIVYKYNKNTCSDLTSIEYITLINNSDVTIYPGKDSINSGKPIQKGAIYNYDTPDFKVDPRNTANSIITGHIVADTLAPSLTITATSGKNAIENGVTNADEITYTFDWSEEVLDFTIEDIAINGGNVKSGTTLTQDSEDKTKYTLVVNTNVSAGNQGSIGVVVEQGACKDVAGHKNIRTQSVITVDKQEPMLISIEAQGQNKELYKAGDIVTIVATYNENIEKTVQAPLLNLQFLLSGNAKGTVSEGIKEGNKIIYTYTITDKDNGYMFLKAYKGTVTDSAGNDTVVSSKLLSGDIIIADTIAPELLKITAEAPDKDISDLAEGETVRYGIGTVIKITAEFSEAILGEIPTLEIKFGTTTRQINSGIIDNNKIIYSYTVQENDNGLLAISNITGMLKDLAENQLNITWDLIKENILSLKDILVDTKSPEVELAVISAENEIKGINNNYKDGTKLIITATTDEYVYNNQAGKLSIITKEDIPNLGIKFGEKDSKGKAIFKEVAYKNNKTIFTYEYTILDSENGLIELSFNEDKYYDVALNGNNSGVGTKNSLQVIADTEKPRYKDQTDIVYENGQYKVEFNENVYYLDGKEVKQITTDNNSIKLKFEGQEIAYNGSVNGTLVTFIGEKINAKPYLGSSTLCDAAGNLYSYYDTVAPVLQKLEVTNPTTGTYKAGQEITIVATFNEKIVVDNIPNLSIGFGDGDVRQINNATISENTISYTYTIAEGDNGVLKLVGLSGIVKDAEGNKLVLDENTEIQLTGNVITADTIAPTLVITSDATITNAQIVTYKFTWSEDVTGFTEEDIDILNGTSYEFIKLNDKEYILKVGVTNEGRQVVKVNSGSCIDLAGNANKERVTYNEVIIDYTKPIIRANINGGNFVIDTDRNKSILNETVVINEELSKFEYTWSSSETIPQAGWVEIDPNTIITNGDINLNTEATEGIYYLYVKVTDLAGNTAYGKTKGFVVNNSRITLTANTTEPTNNDITVTVNYGTALTQNRKAGISGKTESADSTKVIVTENSKVYAEATDKAGNKVYAELEISNIDKEAPNAEISYVENEDGSITATITLDDETATVTNPEDGSKEYTFTDNGAFTFEFQDAVGNKGSITAKVDTIDKTAPQANITYTENEDGTVTAKISFNEENVTITNNEGKDTYIFTENGAFTFEFKDKAGNEGAKTAIVTIIEPEEDSEIIFEGLSTIYMNGVRYVKVSPEMTVENLNEKINKEALKGKEVEFVNLTDKNTLKTGTELKLDGETKYVIIVKGDVNCDGKIDFLGDVVLINNYRLGVVKGLNMLQVMAGDINNSGNIDFIPDIVSINNYRLGAIKSL